MEFNPNNKVIHRCLQGMQMEETGSPSEAARLFFQAWNEATNAFEKFIASYYLSRHQENISDKLKWLQTALQLALEINDESVEAAFVPLYHHIAECFEELKDHDTALKYEELAKSFDRNPSDSGPFYHGTKADLTVGDMLTAGFNSNYQSELTMNHIYFTALINGAGLAAALAKGEGHERVYRIVPTGMFENDPNVTNKRFPGNPTRSYRTTEPLKIIGEVTDWEKVTPQEIERWREKLANNKGKIIN